MWSSSFSSTPSLDLSPPGWAGSSVLAAVTARSTPSILSAMCMSSTPAAWVSVHGRASIGLQRSRFSEGGDTELLPKLSKIPLG